MTENGPDSVDPLAGFEIDRSIDAPPWRQIATHVHDAVVSGALPRCRAASCCPRSARWRDGLV